MLLVDTSEVTANPNIEPTLRSIGVQYRVEQLRFDDEQMGDYTNEARSFIVERKKADFWNVKHTISQLEKMSRLEGKKYLFIEGTRKDLERYLFESGHDNPARVLNWGLSVLQLARFQYGVEVCYFRDLEEMMKELYWMDRESGKIGKPIFIKPAKMENPHLTLLCGIEKLGPVKAVDLLNRFGTPLGVFLATDDQILSVKGIGPQMLKRIRDHVE